MFYSVIQTDDVEKQPFGSALADGFGLLDPDMPADDFVRTTTRRLRRLAVAAARTGARFVREGIEHDPAVWLLSPLRMFEGGTAVEACQELDGFRRATVLHGLSTGLDAEPHQLDALLVDDASEDAAHSYELADIVSPPPPPGRLYTCLILGVTGCGETGVEAFCAMVVPDAETMRRKLRMRYGEELADPAVIREGFDRCQEGAAFVSDAMAAKLARAQAAPDGVRNRRLAVHLDLRCEA